MKSKRIYKVKVANPKDANACINLSQTSWPAWWSENETLGKKHIRACIQQKRCLVAKMDNEIIGFLVWGNLWNKIHLQDIFVNKDYRQIGIATELINQAIKTAKKGGFKEVISDSDIGNKKSIAFHLSAGFKKCGYIKNNWDNEDSYVFSRKI